MGCSRDAGRRRRRSATWLSGFALVFAAGCPNYTPPPPDSCSDPQAPPGLEQVQLGSGQLDDVFEPWIDGQVVPLVTGSQGGTMIPVRIRLVGDSLPECFAQATYLTGIDDPFAPDACPPDLCLTDAGMADAGVVDAGPPRPLVSVPLHAYEQADGSRVTRTLWLIFDGYFGDTITVETIVGELSVRRDIVLGGGA